MCVCARTPVGVGVCVCARAQVCVCVCVLCRLCWCSLLRITAFGCDLVFWYVFCSYFSVLIVHAFHYSFLLSTVPLTFVLSSFSEVVYLFSQTCLLFLGVIQSYLIFLLSFFWSQVALSCSSVSSFVYHDCFIIMIIIIFVLLWQHLA